MLRYDIFNQKLILDYENIYGASSSLVLRNEWVESFAFEGQSLLKCKDLMVVSGFFQLVTEGPVYCLYHWSKEHLLNLTLRSAELLFYRSGKKIFSGD